MSAVATAGQPPTISQLGAFAAVLHRDLYVTWRELPAFLAQVILQPLFLLLVFGKVLGSLGYTQHGYANLLFPGLLALTAVITSMQTLAFPLVAEFGWTREIEDRLLAPMPTSYVAAEKVVFAVVREELRVVRAQERPHLRRERRADAAGPERHGPSSSGSGASCRDSRSRRCSSSMRRESAMSFSCICSCPIRSVAVKTVALRSIDSRSGS